MCKFVNFKVYTAKIRVLRNQKCTDTDETLLKILRNSINFVFSLSERDAQFLESEEGQRKLTPSIFSKLPYYLTSDANKFTFCHFSIIFSKG